MTRYPVHVGSIPAYQLREMDRINEPYRKERKHEYDNIDPEARCPTCGFPAWGHDPASAYWYVQRLTRLHPDLPDEEEPPQQAEGVRAELPPAQAGIVQRGHGTSPVSEPVETRCGWINDAYWQCDLGEGHQGDHHWEGPVMWRSWTDGEVVSEPVDGLRSLNVEAIVRQVIEDIEEAERDIGHPLDTEAIGNLLYENLRPSARFRSALAAAPAEDPTYLEPVSYQSGFEDGKAVGLAAAPAEDRGGVDLPTLLHRHGIGCRGRDTESSAWHVAAAAALVADGVERSTRPEKGEG